MTTERGKIGQKGKYFRKNLRNQKVALIFTTD
jgi:hypothetical protein